MLSKYNDLLLVRDNGIIIMITRSLSTINVHTATKTNCMQLKVKIMLTTINV